MPYGPKAGGFTPMPWCHACQSYHSVGMPGCFAIDPPRGPVGITMTDAAAQIRQVALLLHDLCEAIKNAEDYKAGRWVKFPTLSQETHRIAAEINRLFPPLDQPEPARRK